MVSKSCFFGQKNAISRGILIGIGENSILFKYKLLAWNRRTQVSVSARKEAMNLEIEQEPIDNSKNYLDDCYLGDEFGLDSTSMVPQP